LNLEAISDNLEKMFDSILENKTYKGPVLFIKGGNSDYILSADYKDIYIYFPYAEIVTIEGATHWVHADEPDEFHKLTYQFLQQE